MSERIAFTALGYKVVYELNDAGTHEGLWFDGDQLIDSFGYVGCYTSEAWQRTILLKGAVQAAARNKVMREHAEHLLASELKSIRDLWAQINAED